MIQLTGNQLSRHLKKTIELTQSVDLVDLLGTQIIYSKKANRGGGGECGQIYSHDNRVESIDLTWPIVPVVDLTCRKLICEKHMHDLTSSESDDLGLLTI